MLPDRPQSPSQIDATTAAKGASGAKGVQGPLTIALAEDVEEIQILAATWLTSVGHRVICAENGRELLRKIESEHVDLVISDVMMPEADGFEVIRALRRDRPNLRIISMSGGAPVMSMDQCLRVARTLGAHVVLPKPFNRKQLFAAIDGAFAT